MTTLDTALGYAARGWCPIPIPHRQKGPKIKGWPRLRITDKNAHDYFNGAAQNIGVVLGLCSGGLADVDLDCPQALRVASSMLLGTGSVFGRVRQAMVAQALFRGHGRCRDRRIPARAVRQREARRSDRRRDAWSNCAAIRPTGREGRCRRSSLGASHPSGEEIEWAEDGDLGVIREPELRRSGSGTGCRRAARQALAGRAAQGR